MSYFKTMWLLAVLPLVAGQDDSTSAGLAAPSSTDLLVPGLTSDLPLSLTSLLDPSLTSVLDPSFSDPLTDLSFTDPDISSTAFVDSSLTGVGILQLITPTAQASQVPLTAVSLALHVEALYSENANQFLQIESLSGDAIDFYTSYTQIDKFDFESGLVSAIQAVPLASQQALAGAEGRLISLYGDMPTSLLDDPVSCISRLHDSASLYPQDFSSSLLSQASGVLLGYESIATRDVLSATPTQASVTPGMSIDVGAAQTGGAAGGSGSAPGPTSSSSKAAAPAPTAGLTVVTNAIVGAAGLVAVALM